MYVKKFTSFCGALKGCAKKKKIVIFFCLTVYKAILHQDNLPLRRSL